jgi:hypothetical protein
MKFNLQQLKELERIDKMREIITDMINELK